MRIIIDFEDEFNTLVTRGQIQIIGLRDIVNSIKKYTEHTRSEEFRSAIHQIEEKIAPILEMFFSIPNPKSFEFTQLYCFQLREKFRWKTVEWEYGTENQVTTQSKEMCNYAQILADLYGTKSDSYTLQVNQPRVDLKQMKNLITYSVFTLPLTTYENITAC